MPDGIRLIIGLGNPGVEYEKTRHNAGIWFVDAIADQMNLSFRKDSHLSGFLAKFSQGYLCKPTTFMNDSGRTVAAVAHFYKLKPQEILIVHDELDIPAGDIRLKYSGGHGGHNGLRSIIQCLNSRDFYRLRIGIGHPGHKDRVTPYVLSKPSADDLLLLQKAITNSLDIIPDLIEGNMAKATQTLRSLGSSV